MSKKQYTVFRLIIAMVLAALVAISISSGNYLIPIFVTGASVVFLLVLRKNVKKVLADERDYQAAGQAARWAISIYAGLAFLFSMLSFSLKEIQPQFEIIGSTLAYSACAIMLLYSLVFTALNKHDQNNKMKFWTILIVIVISLFFTVISFRVVSSEDAWLCQNGRWVAHGQTDGPQPDKPCEINE